MFTRLYTHHFFRNHNFYDREKYENILHDPESQLGRRINIFISLCVFLAVWVIVFETVADWGEKYKFQFFLIDAGVSIIFAIEYLYRFMRARSKSYFIKKPMNVIDFLSFWPFFLGLIFVPLAWFDVLKILRLVRILRLFEVSSQSPIALGFMRTLQGYKKEYKAILGIFGTLLIIFSTFVHYFESTLNPDFASIPHTLWWGIVTMTTVGYGDMTPITLWGKMCGAVLILFWPVLLAVISSITILVFMDVAEAHKQALFKSCAKCRTRNNDEANYCLHCGHTHFLSEVIEEKRPKIAFISKLFSKIK